MIKVLKDEIARKNMTIRQLIDTQISMEQRLAKIEQVLWFEDQTSLMKLKVSKGVKKNGHKKEREE